MFKKYYVEHSKFSHPSNFCYLYDHFPESFDTIRKMLHGLFLHYADLDLLNVSVASEKYHELNLRYVKNILQCMMAHDPGKLTQARPPHDRVMGVCRDTALLFCSILRSRHIPARICSGFVTYFIPGLYLDGFCVEYYDEKSMRWKMIDTRTMPEHINHYQLNIDFDVLDMPPSKFISATEAWRLCRFKKADPVRFGSRQHRGLFTVRNRLIQ